jgi:hypothetical protein
MQTAWADGIEFYHINDAGIMKMVGGDLSVINEGANNQILNKQGVSMHSM